MINQVLGLFANPEILYLVPLPLLLMLVFVVAERARRALLAGMTLGHKPQAVMGAGFERRLVMLCLLCLGTLFLVLAAARPQWGSKLETVRSRGIDILIAIDVSDSMRATDVSPSRLAKAKQQVEKLLQMLRGDRVGLIAFAGSAYSYCPLTVDYSAVRLFLQGLEPGTIADGGTDLGAAVREGIASFSRSESNAYKVLVLFSDGEHHEADPSSAVQEAVELGIRIYTVGIGHAGKAGERIPLEERNGQITYKQDLEGNLVITRLDEARLQEIAAKAEGSYFRVSDAGTELVQIYRQLQEAEKTEFGSRRQNQKEDRYQWPLSLGFALLTLAYGLGRRSHKRLRRTQTQGVA